MSILIGVAFFSTVTPPPTHEGLVTHLMAIINLQRMVSMVNIGLNVRSIMIH